nr:hypothetical protein CFP56_32303 [Quercus suber]
MDKQHFTSLYSRVQPRAITSHKIRSSWAKSGLISNPERVLGGMQPPLAKRTSDEGATMVALPSPALDVSMRTPTNFADFEKLRSRLAKNFNLLDVEPRAYLQKLWNAAESVYTNCALLLDDNKLLYEQNNERTSNNSVRHSVSSEGKSCL